MTPVEIIECPRDAIQGWPHPVSTEDKLAYYRSLLDVGFSTLDMGSFVSHKAVPQMADTRAVFNALADEGKLDGPTKPLVIVANERGAKDARATHGVRVVGFPLSVSATFQMRNTGADSDAAWLRLSHIKELLESTGIELVVYLSMGFGNPYGDDWSESLLIDWIGELERRIAPDVIALSDTVGNATPELLTSSFRQAIEVSGSTALGAHLHAAPWDVHAKIQAVWDAGCRRFDSAMRGIGGCPMAQEELVGNVPTEALYSFLKEVTPIEFDQRAWNHAQSLAVDLFQDG